VLFTCGGSPAALLTIIIRSHSIAKPTDRFSSLRQLLVQYYKCSSSSVTELIGAGIYKEHERTVLSNSDLLYTYSVSHGVGTR
jgi:hypothetical protein